MSLKTTPRIQLLLVKKNQESTFMHNFLPIPTFRRFSCYFKSQNKSTLTFTSPINYVFEGICIDNGMTLGSAEDLIWEMLNIKM